MHWSSHKECHQLLFRQFFCGSIYDHSLAWRRAEWEMEYHFGSEVVLDLDGHLNFSDLLVPTVFLVGTTIVSVNNGLHWRWLLLFFDDWLLLFWLLLRLLFLLLFLSDRLSHWLNLLSSAVILLKLLLGPRRFDLLIVLFRWLLRYLFVMLLLKLFHNPKDLPSTKVIPSACCILEGIPSYLRDRIHRRSQSS